MARVTRVTWLLRRSLRRRNLSRRDVLLRTMTLVVATACFGYALLVATRGGSAPGL